MWLSVQAVRPIRTVRTHISPGPKLPVAVVRVVHLGRTALRRTQSAPAVGADLEVVQARITQTARIIQRPVVPEPIPVDHQGRPGKILSEVLVVAVAPDHRVVHLTAVAHSQPLQSEESRAERMAAVEVAPTAEATWYLAQASVFLQPLAPAPEDLV